MIGLIPFLVDRFTTEHCGPDERQTILATCDLPADFSFSVAQTYDDDLCRQVITAMVAQIGLPLATLYDRLGRYFLCWLHANLGGFFAGASDTSAFLLRLPTVYNGFAGSARGAGLPGAADLVTVRQFDDLLRVTYQSQARFAAFYASFMRAVADHFQQDVSIAIVAGDLEAQFCVFDVTIQPARLALRASTISTVRALPATVLCHGQ
jgi:hypothetical protein